MVNQRYFCTCRSKMAAFDWPVAIIHFYYVLALFVVIIVKKWVSSCVCYDVAFPFWNGFDNFVYMAGKSYDLVSFAAQEPDATVFLASASESKVGGCWITFLLWTYNLIVALLSRIHNFLLLKLLSLFSFCKWALNTFILSFTWLHTDCSDGYLRCSHFYY